MKTIQFTKEYQKESKQAVIQAKNNIPAYLNRIKSNPEEHENIDAVYGNIPQTTKRDLREHTWRGFIPAALNPDLALQNAEISLVQTSGTTEDRVTNVWFQKWWDESEKKSWKYNQNLISANLGNHKEAILTSPHNTGILSNSIDLSFKERSLGRFLYLNEKSNPTLWNQALLQRMVLELNEFQPVMLEANPSYLSILANYISQTSQKIIQPKLIALTYENPSLISRKIIQNVFKSPIISSYGSTETGYVLMECEHGFFHQNSESCRIDFQPIRPEFGNSRLGRIFVTTFHNPWRVLIKFDIGDMVVLPESNQCKCKRNNGYIFQDIEGRVSNLTFTTLGKCITPRMLDAQINKIDGIINYQLVQNKNHEYHLQLVVIDSVFKPQSKSDVKNLMIALYGKDAQVTIEIVQEIQTELSGKYRHSKCLFNFNPDQLFL